MEHWSIPCIITRLCEHPVFGTVQSCSLWTHYYFVVVRSQRLKLVCLSNEKKWVVMHMHVQLKLDELQPTSTCGKLYQHLCPKGCPHHELRTPATWWCKGCQIGDAVTYHAALGYKLEICWC
jgi:hypothetical protein